MKYSMRYLIRTLVVLPALVLSVVVDDRADAQQDSIDFGRSIKPILSDTCYACHGPDEQQRATDMRLDTPEGLFADLGGYQAITPGSIEESELLTRVFSDDPDFQMPPPEHRKSLAPEEKALLKQWVEQGGKWTAHWAFSRVVKHDSPNVHHSQWPRNFVDRFILHELESRGFEPSEQATRRELIRRLSFDLTGLPPSVEEVDAFLNDASPGAYEAVVDRLLRSPHYGERMAVYWLDLVRYADSVGYHGDQLVSVSPYRDYVIEAFNENLPFDQFTIEQIAGDLLEKPTRAQLIASGYNRLGMMSAEGGVQDEEYLAKYAADRVRTASSVWLGVTLGCAECHDHKFDPFTTREFYEFAAFFADIKEKGLYAGANQSGDWGPSIEVPDDILPERLAPLDAQLEALVEQRKAYGENADAINAWVEEIKRQEIPWAVEHPLAVATYHDVSTEVTEDGSVIVGGDRPDEDCYLVTVELPTGGVNAIRLEALPHESLPGNGPGRAGNGNFVVTEMLIVDGDLHGQVETLKAVYERWPAELKAKNLRLENATATVEQTVAGERHPDKKWSAASAIDLDARGSVWGWAVLPSIGQASELVVHFAEGEKPAGKVTVVIQQYHGNRGHTLGRFRLSSADFKTARADPLQSLPADIREIIASFDEQLDEPQLRRLSEYYVTVAPELAEINEQVSRLEKERETLIKKHTRTSLITVSVPPRETRVLRRGDWMDKSGEVVSPDVPASVLAMHWRDQPTRLDLARWMVSNENPLTARVFVNRIWRMCFGQGLSTVLDDLGSQGQPPTHPELLDRLASEFMESGWDVKRVVKTIVMSETYRQSSRQRTDLQEVDPGNQWLARQSRFRIDAEFIRDHALSVSGLLSLETGGASVRPYQPPGLYRHLNFPKRTYQSSAGPDQYRRGLYTHWQRQYLHPAMRVFDAPPREECTAARARSSTPLGALVLLNDPSYVEAAAAFAERVLGESTSDEERIQSIFRIAFSRNANEREIDVLTELLVRHREHYVQNADAAKQLLSVGQGDVGDDEAIIERAAWTSVCRAVINMHEFVQRK